VWAVAKRTQEVIESVFVLSDFLPENLQDLSILLSEVDDFLVLAPMSISLANGYLLMTDFAFPHAAKEKGKTKSETENGHNEKNQMECQTFANEPDKTRRSGKFKKEGRKPKLKV